MRILVIVNDKVEDVELFTSVEFLRRCNVDVDIASISDLSVKTKSGIEFKANLTIDNIGLEHYSMVIVPGTDSMPELIENEKIKEIILDFYGHQKWIASIGSGPLLLAQFGLLDNKKFTCYPGYEEGVNGEYIKEKKVVIDGKIVTSKGAGTAIDFVFAIINEIFGEGKAKEVATMTQFWR